MMKGVLEERKGGVGVGEVGEKREEVSGKRLAWHLSL